MEHATCEDNTTCMSSMGASSRLRSQSQDDRVPAGSSSGRLNIFPGCLVTHNEANAELHAHFGDRGAKPATPMGAIQNSDYRVRAGNTRARASLSQSLSPRKLHIVEHQSASVWELVSPNDGITERTATSAHESLGVEGRSPHKSLLEKTMIRKTRAVPGYMRPDSPGPLEGRLPQRQDFVEFSPGPRHGLLGTQKKPVERTPHYEDDSRANVIPGLASYPCVAGKDASVEPMRAPKGPSVYADNTLTPSTKHAERRHETRSASTPPERSGGWTITEHPRAHLLSGIAPHRAGAAAKYSETNHYRATPTVQESLTSAESRKMQQDSLLRQAADDPFRQLCQQSQESRAGAAQQMDANRARGKANDSNGSVGDSLRWSS